MSLGAWLPKSLSGRLVAYNVAAFYALLGLAFLTLYWAIGTVLESRSDNEFKEDTIEFSDILAQTGIEGVIEEMNNETFLEYDNSFMLLFKSPAKIIHETPMDYWQNFQPEPEKLQAAFEQVDNVLFDTRFFELNDTNARIVYAPLSPEILLVMAESTEETDEIMQLLAGSI